MLLHILFCVEGWKEWTRVLVCVIICIWTLVHFIAWDCHAGEEHPGCHPGQEEAFPVRGGGDQTGADGGALHHHEPRLCREDRAAREPQGSLQVGRRRRDGRPCTIVLNEKLTWRHSFFYAFMLKFT